MAYPSLEGDAARRAKLEDLAERSAALKRRAQSARRTVASPRAEQRPRRPRRSPARARSADPPRSPAAPGGRASSSATRPRTTPRRAERGRAPPLRGRSPPTHRIELTPSSERAALRAVPRMSASSRCSHPTHCWPSATASCSAPRTRLPSTAPASAPSSRSDRGPSIASVVRRTRPRDVPSRSSTCTATPSPSRSMPSSMWPVSIWWRAERLLAGRAPARASNAR